MKPTQTPLTRSAGQAWSMRWSRLARSIGHDPQIPVLVALSGGADSVLMLHLLAASVPRPRVFALHVNHGLRGAESAGDARFCRELCRELGVALRTVHVELEAEGPSLEARARSARYRALSRECARLGVSTIVTGHHADDSLETLLQRWVRGDALEGVVGPRAWSALPAGVGLNPSQRDVAVLRPLLTLRRSEVRLTLEQHGLTWRDDSSNEDLSITRNRIRHVVLPRIAESCGDDALDHLRAFGRAVRGLEDAIARRTAHLAWEPVTSALAMRPPDRGAAAARLARGPIASLPRALQRRALWRLLSEATGHGPGRHLLALTLDDLARARCTRRHLPGRWTLILRAAELLLVPPPALRNARGTGCDSPQANALLPFPPTDGRARNGSEPPLLAQLRVPGQLLLEDERVLCAEVVVTSPDTSPPRGPNVVELDAGALPDALSVRFAQPGDRFRPLGAPGSRRLGRFLADAGIPREERGRIPLVFAGPEILWVAGVRPSEPHRVRAGSVRRLRLSLAPARDVWAG